MIEAHKGRNPTSPGPVGGQDCPDAKTIQGSMGGLWLVGRWRTSTGTGIADECLSG